MNLACRRLEELSAEGAERITQRALRNAGRFLETAEHGQAVGRSSSRFEVVEAAVRLATGNFKLQISNLKLETRNSKPETPKIGYDVSFN